MRCKLCREKAVYSKYRFCRDHFIRYYEKRVDKVAKHVKGKGILIAVSGGKDSSALAYALSKIDNLKTTLYYIDLGIGDYSKESLDSCRRLSEVIGIPLIVDRLVKNIPELEDYCRRRLRSKPCSACGLSKRYMMNKYAFENGFDLVATGHNMDDEACFILQNIKSQDIHQLFRLGPLTDTEREDKLIGRVKPLYYLTEKENALYCILNNIPFYHEECPYSAGSRQIRLKEIINFAEMKEKEFKLNLLKTFIKLKKNFHEEKITLNKCESCSYPTTASKCKYCRMIREVRM